MRHVRYVICLYNSSKKWALFISSPFSSWVNGGFEGLSGDQAVASGYELGVSSTPRPACVCKPCLTVALEATPGGFRSDAVVPGDKA